MLSETDIKVSGMLSKLFRKRRPSVTFPPPNPDCIVEVVGDIHGRADLLRGLPPVEDGAVRVFVGDYVDRGPRSREVLEILHEGSVERGWCCLKGNHEAMLLGFLDAPVNGRRWLRYGGLQTLASFGIGGVVETADESQLLSVADQLREALSPGLLEWLQALPSLWSSNTLTVVHAALDPLLPVGHQPSGALIWGHADFGKLPRQDGQWVVHGHTIVDAPRILDGVISVDTGAYATGRLTMARITPDGQVSFSTAQPSGR